MIVSQGCCRCGTIAPTMAGELGWELVADGVLCPSDVWVAARIANAQYVRRLPPQIGRH